MTGLVLEGGGVRGIYTAGVLDVFMEHGLVFDGVVGVSAGAIHGCSFLSNQNGRSIRYYKKYCKNPRFMSMKSWLKTGNVVETEFCYHELPEVLDPYDYEAFNKSTSKFYVVCTNIETGKAEYIRVKDMKGEIDCLRASASLPYLSRIVEINGKKYLDGGCADSIPVKAFCKMGYDKNIVVRTRHAEYRKSKEQPTLAKIVYRKYPEFVKTLLQRHEMYNETLAEIAKMEQDGSVFVIQPKVPLDIGRLEGDPEKIQRVYDMGRADAAECMDRLINWLK